MNPSEENENAHYSKRNQEKMLENSRKGLFIAQYFTCKNCSDISDTEGKVVDAVTKVIKDSHTISGGFAVGWTEKGLQVWCEDCDNNVINLDFKGQKIGFISDSNI